MSTVSRWGATALRALPAEAAHRAALQALNLGLVPTSPKVTTPRLETELAGLTLPNPLGLAAGFDKNAEALRPLARMGFGFVEVGAATPKPQPGNAKPRLFRLTQDQAAINRFGFNNDGMHDIADRLAARPKDLCLGLNLGANKDSPDRAADYASVLKHCAAHVDFATVNVSSPNTERLRDLQGREALAALLDGVAEANSTGVPLFLKIAPDLDEAALDDICEVAQNA
ncbi:MAG: dihydroorotate dehydrogenase (quinone), partial [Pseudomonadota bacterium]